MGCSFPAFIVVVSALIAMLVVSFIGGAIGKNMVGDVGLPSVFSVDSPHVQLPGEVIFLVGNFEVTNTLITSWITMLALVLLFWAVTRRIKLIPTRLQNLIESVIEWLLNFCIDVAGEQNGRRFFPIIVTIFLFVFMNAWINLIPGFGSITYTGAEHHAYPLLRGANTDISFTLALSLISFVFVVYVGLSMGRLGFIKTFINFSKFGQGVAALFRGKVKSGLGDILMGGVDIFVGILESVTFVMRIVSFMFRLFGNMLGGEILILVMIFLMPYGVAVIFYGFEMLVGLVQALIFGGLTLVFATIAATPHGEPEEGH